MSNLRLAVVSVLSISSVLFGLMLPLPMGTGETISITIGVENSDPIIQSISILDDSHAITTVLDSAERFYIEVSLADDNTLADIDYISIIIHSPDSYEADVDSEEDHYTFSWDPSGFVNEGGVGSIYTGDSSAPSSLSSGQGSWVFSLRLSTLALPSQFWTVIITASDETSNVIQSRSIEVIGTATPPMTQIGLCRGLNLVTWVGRDGTFSEVIPHESPVYKIWRRTPDGDYLTATYYQEQGSWWSSDSGFTGLVNGEAYFFESTEDIVLDIEEPGSLGSCLIKPGLNLIGWPFVDSTFEDAFPQDGSDYSVTKVWRRLPDGSYSFAQYFPSENQWWSSDVNFVGLECGCGYFVEAIREVVISP